MKHGELLRPQEWKQMDAQGQGGAVRRLSKVKIDEDQIATHLDAAVHSTLEEILSYDASPASAGTACARTTRWRG